MALLPCRADRVRPIVNGLDFHPVFEALQYLAHCAAMVSMQLVVARPHHTPPVTFRLPSHLDYAAIILLLRLFHPAMCVSNVAARVGGSRISSRFHG